MAGYKYLDEAGVSALWERIKQLVYECCCNSSGGGVTYWLESDENTITLVGSDGSRSSVSVVSTAVCDNEDQ